MAWAEVYFRRKWHIDLSSRLATTDIGVELGAAVPLLEELSCWDPIYHNVTRAEAYLSAKFHVDPSNRLATIHQRHRDRTRQTGQRDRQRFDSIRPKPYTITIRPILKWPELHKFKILERTWLCERHWYRSTVIRHKCIYLWEEMCQSSASVLFSSFELATRNSVLWTILLLCYLPGSRFSTLVIANAVCRLSWDDGS